MSTHAPQLSLLPWSVDSYAHSLRRSRLFGPWFIACPCEDGPPPGARPARQRVFCRRQEVDEPCLNAPGRPLQRQIIIVFSLSVWLAREAARTHRIRITVREGMRRERIGPLQAGAEK